MDPPPYVNKMKQIYVYEQWTLQKSTGTLWLLPCQSYDHIRAAGVLFQELLGNHGNFCRGLGPLWLCRFPLFFLVFLCFGRALEKRLTWWIHQMSHGLDYEVVLEKSNRYRNLASLYGLGGYLSMSGAKSVESIAQLNNNCGWQRKNKKRFIVLAQVKDKSMTNHPCVFIRAVLCQFSLSSICIVLSYFTFKIIFYTWNIWGPGSQILTPFSTV